MYPYFVSVFFIYTVPFSILHAYTEKKEGGGGMDWQVEEENGRVCLRASRPDDGRGLYKAWVRGPMARCLLGTLAPSGGRLFLRRTLPVDDLRAKGCWPVVAVEEELALPFRREAFAPKGWRRCGKLTFPDPLVDAAFSRANGGFFREEAEGGLILAYPYTPACPFPLTPLFCLARVEDIEGKPYLLFSFDREKTPVFPHNPGPCG